MRNYSSFLIIIFLFFSFYSYGQELNCRVQVVHQQIQGTNKQVYQTLQNSIFEFMNNTKWTDHAFTMDERIECNIMINITSELSTDEYKATIQIQSTRPVFNSSYNSIMFNYLDNDFQFQYVEYQPLDFSISTFNSNLTSTLAFYAYLILGLDYDSYSMNGGQEFYQKAETIINNAQNAKEKGWKAYEGSKNRYWIIENLMDQKFSGIRDCLYQYHRIGMDVMSEKPDDGRSVIAESLKLIQQVHRAKPGSFILQLFFNAKADELVNIFSESFTDEKSRVYAILREVDPANLSKYQKLMETTN
ncbi:MAG: DUF4835 family protein [Bacteroidota bacterium]